MNSSLLSALTFGLALIIALSTVTALGTLDNANLAMVDRLFHLFPNQQPTPPILLISTTESQRRSSTGLVPLVAALQDYKPRSIYLLGHESHIDKPALAALPGVTLVESTSRRLDDSTREQAIPESAKLAFMTSVSLKAGYYREWHPTEQLGARSYTAFQADIGIPVNAEAAIIDFSMEDGLLPLVTAARVLDEGLPHEIIADKIVLVGAALRPGLPGFTVPVSSQHGFSQLELQGYVLHSVLSNRLLDFSGFIRTAVGVLLLCILSSLLFRWLPASVSAMLAVAICLLIVVMQWLAVKFNILVLPAWELIIAQLANLLAVYQSQRNQEEQSLNGLIARANSRLSERIQPVNFNSSSDPWRQILSFVNQQMNIKRSIFLEKVETDHRVKEIEALNCSLDDVSEQRRDYERAPYSIALEANGPVEPFRDYFTEVEKGEVQYIAPLNFGGEVLGFWALSLLPAKNWNRVAFENNVRSFALQIAELLYHRLHWHNRWKKSESTWRKLLSVQAGLTLHRQLNNTVDLLEHRLDALEDVLNGLTTAVIVYDVFGQVLHTNSIMEDLARENDVPVYKLTAMELMALSSDIALDEARNKLRYVTLKHQTLAQNSNLFSDRGSYLLYIRPLLIKQGSNNDQVQPFQTRGILFEFSDLTQVQQHDEIRQEIADQYFHQLRDKLSYISSATRKLGGKEAGDQVRVISDISEKIRESEQLTIRVESELRNQIHMREQTIPTNIVPLIRRIMTGAEEAAMVKGLSLELEPPATDSLNFVEPWTFEQLISALLNLLIEDAVHGSPIKLEISNTESTSIHLVLSNKGQGLPEEQLTQTLATYQSYLDMNEDPLTQVSALTQQVPLWGGKVSIQSDIGTGFCVDIWLRTFNFSLPESKP
jgi:CHASE2 domain-containing sensor protein/signal transduction histidine kinase